MNADDVELQLAEARSTAFTKEGWGFELKLDGFRLLAERVGGKVRLVLRRGREATRQFPEIVTALEQLPGGDFVIDGELVIQDEHGKPIFQRLLTRGTLTGQREIDAGVRVSPAVFFAFDLLMLAGVDLRSRPLRERKAFLLQHIPKVDRVLPVEYVETEGERLLEVVKAQELEGIVAKDLSAPYRGGRGHGWFKIALKHVYDFAVVGYADDFNALYLATWDGLQFVFAGKVGSGITPKISESIRPLLESTTLKEPPCIGEVPVEKEARWCTPNLVIEVRYKNWPEGLSIREPAFLRFREDKLPTECPTPRSGYAPSPLTPSRGTKISNTDKVLFPDDGITKGQVLEYYRQVSKWLLPYLLDRPLMMTRYPDGIRGKSFFQKGAPLKSPDFVRTIRVRNEEENRDIDQIVCDDLRTLEWCANLASLPLHIPAGRIGSLDKADWAVVDFDPKGAPFEHVITLANSLHARCERAGLPNFVKTSGSNGMHVLIPLARQLDHTGARQLAELLAALLVAEHPDLATLERVIPKRQGRVYVDALQNGNGKLIASPFCVRAVPGAAVSMPLTWDEVKPGLTARTFTIKNAIERLETLGDPMHQVMTLKVDLSAVLPKLAS
jgi:bifunctional non-homologous end joining protein LigD